MASVIEAAQSEQNQEVSSFENVRTVEQFKEETKSKKLFFNFAKRRDGSFVVHADGKTKQIAITNEAGQTVAWCSKAVASEVAQGINPNSNPKGLAIVDIITPDGELFTRMVHPGNGLNRIEGIEL